jgi:isoquinoline 1-oxidoreductase beta subunit
VDVTCNSIRINETSKVAPVMTPSDGFSDCVGEPKIGVATPVALNAHFAARGKQIRSVPPRDQNITFA